MNIYRYTLAITFGALVLLTSCRSDAQKGSSDHDHHLHGHQQSTVTAEVSQMAEITFENAEFDFGTINEGEKVSHTYYFTNTSDVPLVIQNAAASCGCTVPEWPREPIPPGGSGQIEVAFDSNGKPDAQNRTVSIVANTDPSITYLRIKGMVIPKATQAMGPVRRN
jgi:hypothetical protein